MLSYLRNCNTQNLALLKIDEFDFSKLFCEHFQYRKINKFGEIKIKYKFRQIFVAYILVHFFYVMSGFEERNLNSKIHLEKGLKNLFGK